ncbi:MAG: T9SS type A sorting domain-containing protein [Flavipsychrobacter sp.]|nr:T9SS type A sorting domain-containing protein [Flavipsychrobacter sp.]
MKRILFLLVAISLCIYCVAQPRFSKFYNYSISVPPSTDIYNAVIIDSSYFLANGITNSDSLSSYNSYLAAIDYAGKTLWHKNLFFPGHYNAVSGNHSMIKWDDNTILMTGYELDTAIHDTAAIFQPYLYFFTNNGDSIRFHKYVDSFRIRYFNALTRTSDGCIIAAGIGYSKSMQFVPANGSSSPAHYAPDSASFYFVKFDSLGTIIWEKQLFTVPNIYLFTTFATQVLATDDGGAVLSGFAINRPGVLGTSHIFLRIDSAGNTVWQKNYRKKNYPETSINSFDDICKAAGGGYYFLAEIATLDAGPAGPGNSLLYYGKINDLGDTIWTKQFADTGDVALDGYKYTQAMAIRQRSNGDLLLTGNVYYNSYEHPLLVIADSNGKVKSYREYITVDNPDITQALNTICETPQKNIILAGIAAYYDTLPGVWDTAAGYGWVIQADSFGCLTGGCQSADIRWAANDVEQLHVNSANVQLYPNPGNEQLHIIVTRNIEQVNIADMSGRIIWQGNINHTADVNTSTFAPGLYIVSCYGKSGGLLVRKWSKE